MFQRVVYKILLFVIKALARLAPVYLRDLLHPHCPPTTLRLSDKMLLSI